MIRVVLVDDHAMVRAGLEQLLVAAGDIEVVGSVADGVTAVEHVRRSRPDVVLMDISLPGLDGIRATAAIKAADPDVRVVMLTSFGDRVRVLAAVDAGAAGYILKEADPEDLLRAVRAAARGESPVSPRAGQALFAARTGRLEAADQLTPREREVLLLVAEGLVNKQIARRLGISEKTTKAHLTRVYAAIGVSDRTQAALWAWRNGLLRDEQTSHWPDML